MDDDQFDDDAEVEQILECVSHLNYLDQLDTLMKAIALCISENHALDDNAYVKALGRAQVMINTVLSEIIKDTLKKPLMN